jgi:ligand-binding sensor domain-containing protein
MHLEDERKMPKRFIVSVLFIAALLPGCVDATIAPPATTTLLPTHSPEATSTSTASPVATPTGEASPLPSLSPTIAGPTPSPETAIFGPPGTWVNFTHVERIHALVTEGNYVWAATNGGVVRWDTSDGSYVKYTRTDGLHQNKVTGIAIDDQGNKWFGTEDRTESVHEMYGLAAVSKFDGKTWTTYTTLKQAIEAEYETIRTTVNENELWLVDGQGQIWIMHYPGVQVYDGERWVTYESPDALVEYNPTALTMDALGRIWIASVYEFGHRQGVSVFDGEKWAQYRPEDGFINAPINDMTADDQGNVWGASDIGVSRFDGQEWIKYGWEDGLPSVVNRITVDPSGRLWAATNEGVAFFDSEGWQRYGLADGLSGELVHALAFDEAGRAWFGSYGGFVDSFDGQSWRQYITDDEIADSSVGGLVVDAGGRVWLGDSGALTVFNGQNWQEYSVENGYPGVVPWGMAADATGNVWVYGINGVVKGTHDGVWTAYDGFEQAVEENYDDILTTLAPTNMWLVEPPDAIWVNGQRYDGHSWTSYENVLPGYRNPDTIGAVDARGSTWFGSRSEGLVVFDGQNWTTYDSDNSPLRDNWVREIQVDDEGRVWIATFRGLYVVTGDEWQAFSTEDGLIDDNILSMAFDRQGRAWLGTVGGISVFDGAEWQSYPVMDVEDIVVDGAGNVWAGTLFDGLLIYTARSGQ